MKNRESAARSRQRRLAYSSSLEERVLAAEATVAALTAANAVMAKRLRELGEEPPTPTEAG